MLLIVPPNPETIATSFSFLRSISRPTIKSKNASPISDKVVINALLVIIPYIGPINSPVNIYAGISGCFSFLAIKANTVANIMIIPISKNISLEWLVTNNDCILGTNPVMNFIFLSPVRTLLCVS